MQEWENQASGRKCWKWGDGSGPDQDQCAKFLRTILAAPGPWLFIPSRIACSASNSIHGKACHATMQRIRHCWAHLQHQPFRLGHRPQQINTGTCEVGTVLNGNVATLSSSPPLPPLPPAPSRSCNRRDSMIDVLRVPAPFSTIATVSPFCDKELSLGIQNWSIFRLISPPSDCHCRH